VIPDPKIGGRERKGLTTINAMAMNQKFMPMLKWSGTPRATRIKTIDQYLRWLLWRTQR
jgi:hypothetical protein